ncbi:MAG: hypothetical protein U9N35_01285 [Euryarchaeota archaeon]|nr:hypothetical protein [Euryarchaeota archaeon]
MNKTKVLGKLCGRIALVFLVFWFITQTTDVFGEYEYSKEFLGLVFLFFLADSVFDAAKYRVKLKKVAYGVAKAAFLSWLFIETGEHFDWVGFDYWSQYSDYFIIGFFASILIGYTIGKNRRGIRTVFYGAGFIGIAFWIFTRILDLLPEYQTLILVGSIGAVALGYIVGVFEEERKFRWFHDTEFETTEEAGEPRIREEPRVLKSDIEIKRGKNKISIDKNSIFVPIANGEEMGGVFFGQGSYVVDADLKKYINVFQGMTSLTGSEWSRIKKKMKLRTAEEKDFETLGLKKNEIFDLARIQIEEKEWKKIRKKFKKTVTNVELPFIKVRESEDGDYVKVGPIEVIDREGKGSRVKLGPFKFVEGSDTEWEEQRLYDIAAKIRTKNKEISLTMKNDRTVLEEEDRTVITNPDKVIVKDGDLKLTIKDGKRTLRSDNLYVLEKENKIIMKANGTKIILNEDLKIVKDGKTKVIKNPKVHQEIRDTIDALIQDALDRKEMKELDDLLKRLKEES